MEVGWKDRVGVRFYSLRAEAGAKQFEICGVGGFNIFAPSVSVWFITQFIAMCL